METSKIKILHIHWRYDEYGGGEQYLHDICNAQEELGHKVIVMISSEGKCIAESGRKVYLIEPSMGVRSGKRLIKKVIQIIQDEDPDIIHFHQTHGFMSPLIISAIHKMKPSVKTVHDVGIVCLNEGKEAIRIYKNEVCQFPIGIMCVLRGCFPLLKNGLRKMLLSLWEKEVAKGLDKIIVGSNYMSTELQRNGFLKERIEVIPLYTNKVEKYGTVDDNKDRLMLFVGRLDSVKGVRQFIEALNIIRGKEWRAEIIGEGRLFQEAYARTEILGLKNRVDFVGSLPPDRLDEHYRNAFMVVMPSMIPESFGLVGIEAMAFGKPVIAFDSGGIREWLVDGETGFLVKRGDVKGLADKISELLEDESVARKMGEKGKERVENNYRKEKHLKRLITVYEETIKNVEKTRTTR